MNTLVNCGPEQNPDIYSVFISCLPPSSTAQQHKRIFNGKNGKAFIGTDSKGVRIQNDLISLLLPNVPPEDFPRDKPLKVEIGLVYPYRKSEKKSIVKNHMLVPHTSRPDMDNLLKFLLDCMTRCRFWNDDSQIYRLTASKYWGANPGIYIHANAAHIATNTGLVSLSDGFSSCRLEKALAETTH